MYPEGDFQKERQADVNHEYTLTWRVLTHEHREYSNDWFWTLGAGALIGIGFSIYTNNILLAAILLVGCGAIGYAAARGPREHSVHIDHQGIHVDGSLFTYANLHHFDIIDEPSGMRLIVHTDHLTFPRLLLPLHDTPAQDVYMVLSQHLPHKEVPPRLTDRLAERLGL